MPIKYNKPIHVGNITLIKHVHDMWDVFFGIGFHNHRRVRVNRGFVRVVEGKDISSEHKKLISTIAKS